jgi:hypothetical protein
LLGGGFVLGLQLLNWVAARAQALLLRTNMAEGQRSASYIQVIVGPHPARALNLRYLGLNPLPVFAQLVQALGGVGVAAFYQGGKLVEELAQARARADKLPVFQAT